MIVYRSGTFFTAIGDPIIFGSFYYLQSAAILLFLFRFINALLHRSNHMRNKVKHNEGNNIKKQKLAFKNRSRRDRESNQGPPPCRADVLTTTPGIESRASSLPGRRANHYTIAALLRSNASFNIYKSNVIVYRSGTFFTAKGDRLHFRIFLLPTVGCHFIII